jgi:hypothetical protein
MSPFRTACYGLSAAFPFFAWPDAVLAQGNQPDPYASPAQSGLQAGGLAPPGVGTSTGPTNYDPSTATTQQTLREAEAKDSGRGLEFVWLNAEVGYGIVGLQTFSKNNLVDAGFTQTHQQGFVLGVGAGVRLIFLTLGPRFRFGTFDKWQIWSVDLEAALHLPLGRVEPYFTLGGGYSSVGSFATSSTGWDMSGAGVSIHGWNVRLGFGMDVYLTKFVTIGGNLTGDALFLKRPKSDKVQGGTCANPNACTQAELDIQSRGAVYNSDGTSVGAGMTATLLVGLHF